MAETTDFFSMLDAAPAQPAGQDTAAPSPFQDIFAGKPVNRNQLDPDFDGRLTEDAGKKLGTGWTRDTVVGVQAFDKFYSHDQLLSMEGGAELIDLAARKRRGRRGFMEALMTGSVTDFIPYVGDLASMGVSIKNMKTVRDSLKKMSEQGASALTDQEKILTKLYTEDMERSATSTFGGKVGSILRQAPAFALEFLATGGVFKAGTKALGVATKEIGEEAVETAARKTVAEMVFRAAKQPGVTKESISLAGLGFEQAADDIVSRAASAGVDAARQKALKNTAMKTAEAYVAAYKNPKLVKNVADFLVDYGKRGFFDHMDNVVRDLPPSVLGKLREAAGVAFVEAPIKGALYASFDFLAVNPIAARVAGADEAVTRTELALTATGQEELMRNAKMLAFGTAVAEYASESAGRAFTALGGIVSENVAKEGGRILARRGLRAVSGRSLDAESGSAVRRLLDATYGTDEQLQTALKSLREGTVRSALEGGRLAGEGVTSVAEAMRRPELVDRLVKEKLEFQEKSFLGYWVANKALEKNITPRAVTRLLESMGYDDILGEFMEERYNGFAQGLFGLDGAPDRGFMDRLARAAKGAVPEFEQGAAEILAFAVPVVGRAAISRAYGVLGAGNLGNATEAARLLNELSSISGFTYESSDGIRTTDVRPTDKGSGSIIAEATERWGKESVKAENDWKRGRLSELAERLADIAPSVASLQSGKVGIHTAVARAALKTMEFMITGNPFVAFNDPVKAMMNESLGTDGNVLLNALSSVHRSLYKRQLEASARKSAGAVEKGVTAEPAEAAFTDPAVLAAIRPQMVEAASALSKIVLAKRGAVVVTDADVEKYLDGLFTEGVTEISGKDRAAFKKAFSTELEEAAAGRMSVNVDRNAATFFLKRPDYRLTPAGEVARQVELFLSQNNVNSFIDGSETDDVRAALTDTASRLMDVGRMETAAGLNGADADEVEKARFELALAMFPGHSFANPKALENVLERAGDYARQLVVTNRRLLRPQFELRGRTVNVAGEAGAFRLEFAKEDGLAAEPVPGTAAFKTVEEASSEAQRLGAAPRAAQIAMTPGNAFYAPHASMLLAAPGAGEYMMADTRFAGALEANPYYAAMEFPGKRATKTLAQARAEVTSDLELARRWIDRVKNPFATEAESAAAKAAYDRALADTSKGDSADGYETAAAKAAEANRIRRMQKPDSRGETGFLFTPGALSYNGTVYIPYKYLGSSAALIEDAVETALKRAPNLFRDPAAGSDGYRPAAKEFMQVVYNRLTELRENQGVSQELRDGAHYLTGMFNPDVYNIEAVSHAVSAFVFMQGDAAVRGFGTNGAAYYDVLGHIAPEVRLDTQKYDAFVSLVNRLSGGPVLGDADSAGGLMSLVSGLVPKRFLDDPNALRASGDGVVKETAVTDVLRAGRSVSDGVRMALEGMPLSGFVSSTEKEIANEKRRYAAEMRRMLPSAQSLQAGGNVYLEEDLPALLEMAKGNRDEQMKALSAEVVLKAEAENPEAAPDVLRAAAVSAAARRVESDSAAPDVTASMAEDTLTTRPAVAILIAEQWIKARAEQSGDRNPKIDLDDIFNEWKSRDPLLRESVRRSFVAAASDAGLVRNRAVSDAEASAKVADELRDLVDAEEAPEETFGEETQGDAAEADGVPSGGYNEDRAASALERSPQTQIIRGMMHMNLPGALRNDQSAVEALVSMSSALYPDGMDDANSFASLFNPAAWNEGAFHPAFTDDAAFTRWLDAPRREDGQRLFEDLKVAMRVLGRQGSFDAFDMLKESYGRDILTATEELNADGSFRSVTFVPRRQSLSSELSGSLLRAAKAGSPDIDGAIKLLDAERAAGVSGRAGRFADIAEKMLGPNNWISHTFRSQRVRAMLGEKVGAGIALKKAGPARWKQMGVPEGSQPPEVTWYDWFVDYSGNGIGIIGLRLRLAAQLLKDGKPEAAVRELLRGDALAMKRATDRGGMMVFLNDAAGLEPVTSATRVGGRGKVRGIDQAMSAGQIKFLNSKEFEAAYAAMNGKNGTEGLGFARRFGLWPDGTKVFAAMAGVVRKEAGEDGRQFTTEVGQAPYVEVSDLAAFDFDNGSDKLARVALYNSEKRLERLVQIPRAALKALTGMDKPSYDDTLKLLSKLHGITGVSPKRVAYYTAGGRAATLQSARVAIVVPEDGSAVENFHGMGYVGNADLISYMRLQGFGSAAKIIMTDDPRQDGHILFTKGQYILAGEDAQDEMLTAAQKDLYRLAREYDYVADMDSFKETILYTKADNGKSVMQNVIDGTVEAKVTLPDGAVRTVAEIMPENGIEVVKESVNGTPVNVVTLRTGIRVQHAAAPAKKAEPKHNEVPINYLTDNQPMWASSRAQTDVRLALAEREREATAADIYKKLPDTAKSLIDIGADTRDPELVKHVGAKRANVKTASYNPTMFGVQYLNRNYDGARVEETTPGVPARNPDGSFKVSDPYGGMGAQAWDYRKLSDQERARTGFKYKLASTAANAGGATFRYGLRVNPAAFGFSSPSDPGLAQAVEDRIKQLKAAERRSLEDGDTAAYLKAYTDLVSGAFTDYDGNELQGGQLLSFADLVEYRDGSPVFDRTRLDVLSDEAGEYLFLGGQVEISGRTPSRDGHRAEYPHSVARPAYLVPADGTQTFMRIVTGQDGKLSAVRTPYPEGTPVAGPDAVLLMTPVAKYLAGSDEDWDKSHSHRMPTDWLGREPAHVADAVAKIAAAEKIGDARKLATAEIEALEADGFRAALAFHRDHDPMENPVTATPFSAEYERGIPPLSRPKIDTKEGAGLVAYSNKEVADKLRSISVRVVGDCMMAASVGLTLKTPVNGGRSVLSKPDGAVSPFWDRGGFTVGTKPVMTGERLTAFINAATGISNATFDDLKVALAARAGFKPEHLDLYLYLAYESGVSSQREYEEFHTAFMEWMRGPEGKAVTEGYLNDAYPTRFGGAKLSAETRALRLEILKAAAAEEGPVRHYRLFAKLTAPHKLTALSVARANGGGLKGYTAARPVIDALLRLQTVSIVGTVLTYKKVNLAFANQVLQAERTVETAAALLTNPKSGVSFSASGRADFEASLDMLSGKVKAAREELEGDVELTPLYAATVETADWPRESRAASGGLSLEDAVKKAVSHRVPFDAAVRLTPADTGTRISAALEPVAAKDRTAAFFTLVEDMLSQLFREYSGLGTVNAALDSLLAPSQQNKADRITMVGSDGSSLSNDALRAAMEDIRDNRSGLSPVTVKLGGKETVFPASDFYWMLMQYTLLASGKTLETTRANQALLRSFFGDAAWVAISDHQTAVLADRTAELPLSFATIPSVGPGNRKTRPFPLRGVPDAFADLASLSWGERSALAAAEPVSAEPPEPRDEPAPARPVEKAEAPAAAEEPAAVPQTADSVAMKNITAQAKEVAAAMADPSRRRLPDYAWHGLAEAGRKSAEDERAAAAMADAVVKAAALPWAAPVAGIGEAASAAADILTAMRYAEPAVFTGFLRAAGRAAVLAKNTDAVEQLKSLYAESKAGETADADRVAALKTDPALMTKPPVLRVMEFSIASEPRFKLTAEAKVGTEQIARRLLQKLDLEVTASRAVEDTAEITALGEALAAEKKAHAAALARVAQDDLQLEKLRRIGTDTSRRAETRVLMDRRFDVAAVKRLWKNIREMSARIAVMRDENRNLVTGGLEDVRPDTAVMEELQRSEPWFDRRAATDAELAATLLPEDRVNPVSPLETAAVGFTPDRGAQPAPLAQPELSLDDISASMADDKQLIGDLKITDEELELYATQRGPYDLSDDLQRKLAKRLEALIPPMPDEFEYADGAFRRNPDGSYVRENWQENITSPATKAEMEKAWASLNQASQTGDFALVAQAVEDWKKENGIVYDPNDAYNRGEGFYHDIGAFNPGAPGMLGEIAKVLLAQEKKRRRGDLRYWEDTNNQLVVSSYTFGGYSKAPAIPADLDYFDTATGWRFTRSVSGWEKKELMTAASKPIKSTSAEAEEAYRKLHEFISTLPGRERPGSGLRFVIRPSAQQILWAAKGDVYSGTVGRGVPDIGEDAAGNVVPIYDREFTVDPKAPAASKLGLLSPSVADAIDDRRPQNYNELGVRLALGNFYIEGEDSELPKELRRLNAHLKRAFIRVHGSLDPVAPYAPKTIRRAAGEITASRADEYAGAMGDLIRQADAEVKRLFSDDDYRGYVKKYRSAYQRKSAVHPDSVAARIPLFLGSDGTARRQIGDYIKDAADHIASLKHLGSAKVSLVTGLNSLFAERRAQGGLKDVSRMAPAEYGRFMQTLGLHQTGAIRALSELRDSLPGLPETDRALALADIEAAEEAFFSALHLGRSAAAALRPTVRLTGKDGAAVTVDNPLRAEIAALEAQSLSKPAKVEEPEPLAEEAQLLDEDTGHVDPMDDFTIAFVDSDAWFYGTVFPSFRGGDIRDVLFDKTVLALVPEALAASNRFEAYFGLDGEGSLRKLTRIKGMGHYLENGGFEYDAERAADVTHFGRRKLFRELKDIASGNAFSDEEFELARWYGNAVYYALGNGLGGTQQTVAGVRFDLPWGEKLENLLALVSYDEAERRKGNPDERMYGVHETLLRLKEILPEPLREPAADQLRNAIAAGYRAKGDSAAKNQAAYRNLRDRGWADARMRREKNADGVRVETGELFDVRFSVPVRVTEQLFLASSAARKLIANGRAEEDMRLESAVKPLRETLDRLDRSVRALGWAANGDARLFSDSGTAAPFFKGAGAFRHYARRVSEPATPEYRDAVQKAYESLSDAFRHVRTATPEGVKWVSGEEAAGRAGFQRMFNFLKDLAPGSFDKADTPQEMWAKIAAGRTASLGLDAESTAWDIAKKVYELSVARLHDSAWNEGTLQPVGMDAVGLEAFNRAVGEAAVELGDNGIPPGASFSGVYDVTGALAQGVTAGEALALHAKQIAEMTRYRASVNRMLMTADDEGRPLVYARPGSNPADDTVPDRVWGMLARWWVETYAGPAGKEAFYDESASGRDNAARLYDLITPSLKGGGAVQEAQGGYRRYVLTDVELPPGMTSFSGVSAMKDPAGDDTKARMNVFGGGEAANIVRQVFAVAGYGREDTRMAQVNRALSWSKSASVMASLFFPIATAFESPVAAVGLAPTVFGLTGKGAGFARWLKENNGWLAKAAGVDDVAKAPFMADILRVIGSDDPALVDLKMFATMSGLNLADRAHNMMDTDRTTIARDINAVVSAARKTMGGRASKALRAILEGAMEHSSEVSFEYVINATKMAVFAQMTNRMRQKALDAGRWWDPVRDMRKWANYINAEVGGIDTAMYPWMTPRMQQLLKVLMFSWEWTLGAWEAGGGGVLTQKMFGVTTPKNIRGFMFGRWARMYGAVMIGLPMTMQLMITAFAKAAGAGDDDDEWLSSKNERGHGWKDFDITPLLRVAAEKPLLFIPGLPTLGDIKKRLPSSVLGLPFGSLIPALTGQEGDQATTRRRRYYMHLGKQGWEVTGWFENPARSFLSKMSMPAQRIIEGLIGVTPSMGWEKPFAELGFWERWTSLDPEKSALLNLAGAVAPFSVMSMERAPEAGAISVLGPIGKGMSKTRAEKEMAAMFTAWGDADSYAAIRKGRRGEWTDTKAMAVEWLDALRVNGYDPKVSLKNALTKARAELYEKIHKALPAFPEETADTRALEEAARGLYRLNYIARDLMKSVRARDKNQNIKRSGDLKEITDALMRDAFENPYGPRGTTRDAAMGGDVRGLLATDEVPATLLGYKVVSGDAVPEKMKAYFSDNPQAAGHFEMNRKGN